MSITIKPSKPDPVAFPEGNTGYAKRLSAQSLKIVKWLEEVISSRSTEFLKDPVFFIKRWEEETDMDIPSQYTRGLHNQITSLIADVPNSRKKINYQTNAFCIEYLPVLDDKGQLIAYPEDRLVTNHSRDDSHCYCLKDSIYERLIADGVAVINYKNP